MQIRLPVRFIAPVVGCVAALAPSAGLAQADLDSLRGVVTDGRGVAVARAEVLIVGRGIRTMADESGRFSVPFGSSGGAVVVVRRTGYRPWRDLVLGRDVASQRLKVALEPASSDESALLSGAVRAPDPVRRGADIVGSDGRTFTHAQLATISAPTVRDLLLEIVPDAGAASGDERARGGPASPYPTDVGSSFVDAATTSYAAQCRAGDSGACAVVPRAAKGTMATSPGSMARQADGVSAGADGSCAPPTVTVNGRAAPAWVLDQLDPAQLEGLDVATSSPPRRGTAPCTRVAVWLPARSGS